MWRWDEVMGGEERIDVLFAMSQVCVRFAIYYMCSAIPEHGATTSETPRWQETEFTLL